VLVSGLDHQTAQTPIGTTLYAGPATQEEGTQVTNPYCQTAHFCYSIPIAEAGKGLTLGSVSFRVLTSASQTRVVTQNFARIALVSDVQQVVASTQVNKNSPFLITGWGTLAKGSTPASPLTSSLTIWVQFGNTKTKPFGEELSLQILGTGAYSGWVTIPLP
jgi:hypothetical protein